VRGSRLIVESSDDLLQQAEGCDKILEPLGKLNAAAYGRLPADAVDMWHL